MSEGATTPKPPYYCVIFTSRRKPGIEDDYGAASARMMELGTKMPGFLGIESARNTEGFGITVSYWESEEAIKNWRTASPPEGFKLPADFSPFDKKDEKGGIISEYDRFEPNTPERPLAP